MGAFIERLNDEQRTALAASKKACATKSRVALSTISDFKSEAKKLAPKAAGRMSWMEMAGYTAMAFFSAGCLHQVLTILGAAPTLLADVNGFLLGSWVFNDAYIRPSRMFSTWALCGVEGFIGKNVDDLSSTRRKHRKVVRELKQASLKPEA